jgi:hypothetical protein
MAHEAMTDGSLQMGDMIATPKRIDPLQGAEDGR